MCFVRYSLYFSLSPRFTFVRKISLVQCPTPLSRCRRNLARARITYTIAARAPLRYISTTRITKTPPLAPRTNGRERNGSNNNIVNWKKLTRAPEFSCAKSIFPESPPLPATTSVIIVVKTLARPFSYYIHNIIFKTLVVAHVSSIVYPRERV